MSTEHLLISAAATTAAFGAAALLGYSHLAEGASADATLDELILKNRNFHPIYSAFFANHLPLALAALSKMGASGERLNKYYHSYVPRLRPREPYVDEVQITEATWKLFVGLRILHPNFLFFFEREVARLGRNGAIQYYFPKLMDGMIAELNHALIFIGYGVEVQNDSLVAQGLAFLAYYHTSLGSVDRGSAPATPKYIMEPELFRVLNRVRTDQRFASIAQEIKQIEPPGKIAVLQQFPDYFHHYDVAFNDYTRGTHAIADTLLSFYSQTLDFYILHGITGFRALTQVLSVINDNDVRLQALSYYWRVVLAIYIIDGLPDLSGATAYKTVALSEKASLPDWDAILARAVQDEDEHVIKFTYVCWAESKIYKENELLYQRMAAEKVHLMKHKFSSARSSALT